MLTFCKSFKTWKSMNNFNVKSFMLITNPKKSGMDSTRIMAS